MNNIQLKTIYIYSFRVFKISGHIQLQTLKYHKLYVVPNPVFAALIILGVWLAYLLRF
jgi:hypothetical protein